MKCNSNFFYPRSTIRQPKFAKNLLTLAVSALTVTGFSSVSLAQDKRATALEEVVVTGSYIKSSAGDTARPVQVLDSHFIDGIGANTVADIIAKLSINSGAENQADSFTQGGTQGTANVNLRGLGLSSTLVLINGRRQTISGALSNDGSVFVDTSTIPIEALDRVEILKEGAASTYGSDAIAGVANFILKKDFEDFEINAGFQKVDDGGQKDKDIGFVWGFGNDNTRFLLSGHYLDRSALSAAERPDLVDNAVSSLGNTFLPFAPTTVASSDYAGSYGAFENVPVAGCEQAGGVLIPQASGARCGFHYGPLFNLVNTEVRSQLYGNITHDFDSGIELLAELGYSSNEVKDNPQSPSYPDLTFPVIGADHPSNPFGVGVLWLGRPLAAGNASPLAPRENDTVRASLNLKGDLSDNWGWDAAITYSKNTYLQFQPDTIASRLAAGLAGQGGPNNDEFFDPFVPANNNQALINDFSYMTELERSTELLVLDAVVSGEAFSLPAGSVGLAAGIQIRDERFKVDPEGLYEITSDAEGNNQPVDLIFLGGYSTVDKKRQSFAAFVETKIPLSDSLELTAALRYEKLDSDSSIDPKIALRWQLSDQWIVRASASTAFREPSLSQQYASTVTLNGIQDFNADGSAKGGVSFIRVSANGSDKLKPEESKNYNLGIIYQPTDNFELKLDYWRVDYSDLITVENAQGKIIEDINGVDIQRDAFGNLSGINVDFFNSSNVLVDGIDLEAIWSVNEAWYLSANVSHFLSYELTLPNGETVEAAGFLNNDRFARSIPETKANINVGWDGEWQRANINLNYVSSYQQNLAVPATESDSIDAFITVDAQYSFDVSLSADSQSSAVISLGVENIFDQEPPRVYDGANLSYDPKQHSPLGRVFYAKAKYRF